MHIQLREGNDDTFIGEAAMYLQVNLVGHRQPVAYAVDINPELEVEGTVTEFQK